MTLDALGPYYAWTKSVHLLAVFAWMAGLFYLPRLFVYHTKEPVGSATSETFKTMERLLLRAIMNPALVVAWVFGVLLALTPGVVDWGAGWWYGKLLGLLGMTAFHGYLSAARRGFAEDGRQRTGRHWRFMNEVPTLLLVLIVIMVIVKPF